MRNYIITGATSSFGKVLCSKIALELGSEDKLFMISRSHNEDLKKITNKSIKYVTGVDLLNIDKENQIIEQVDHFFNNSFYLIHTAGDFWDHVPFLEVDTPRALDMMNSHYGTLYSVLQAFLPLMIKKEGGKILTFSCNAVNYNFPNMLPFNAAKAAVEATIKCIAHEYAQNNIVANALAISSLQTEVVKNSKPHGDYEHYLPLEELSQTVLDILNLESNLLNASILTCYKYSDSYYNKGYFERIKQ